MYGSSEELQIIWPNMSVVPRLRNSGIEVLNFLDEKPSKSSAGSGRARQG